MPSLRAWAPTSQSGPSRGRARGADTCDSDGPGQTSRFRRGLRGAPGSSRQPKWWPRTRPPPRSSAGSRPAPASSRTGSVRWRCRWGSVPPSLLAMYRLAGCADRGSGSGVAQCGARLLRASSASRARPRQSRRRSLALVVPVTPVAMTVDREAGGATPSPAVRIHLPRQTWMRQVREERGFLHCLRLATASKGHQTPHGQFTPAKGMTPGFGLGLEPARALRTGNPRGAWRRGIVRQVAAWVRSGLRCRTNGAVFCGARPRCRCNRWDSARSQPSPPGHGWSTSRIARGCGRTPRPSYGRAGDARVAARPARAAGATCGAGAGCASAAQCRDRRDGADRVGGSMNGGDSASPARMRRRGGPRILPSASKP
jgi:hypothetical protein